MSEPNKSAQGQLHDCPHEPDQEFRDMPPEDVPFDVSWANSETDPRICVICGRIWTECVDSGH